MRVENDRRFREATTMRKAEREIAALEAMLRAAEAPGESS
jgi:hypothetical protein